MVVLACCRLLRAHVPPTPAVGVVSFGPVLASLSYTTSADANVSGEAGKAMRREIRHWRLHRRSDKTLGDLARMFNVIVQGWINYYGRYYPSMLYPTLRPLNDYLVRWAQRKYKRLRRHAGRARRFLADVARREPNLFAHWRFGLRPRAG